MKLIIILSMLLISSNIILAESLPMLLAPTEQTAQADIQEQNIDVDLSLLSATMSYGQMFDMLINPNNYEGKLVKIKGQFSKYFDEISKKTYYTINIADNAGCCAIGVEFLLKNAENYVYPNDGEEISVTGIFKTYEENGNLYATLSESIIEE